jgi:hypothetical protein
MCAVSVGEGFVKMNVLKLMFRLMPVAALLFAVGLATASAQNAQQPAADDTKTNKDQISPTAGPAGNEPVRSRHKSTDSKSDL